MDNDNKIIHVVKDFAKKCRFKMAFRGKKILSQEEGNRMISNFLQMDAPIAVGRFGAVEARCANKYLSKKSYTDYNIESIKSAAGVFPNIKENIDRFVEVYLNAAKELDVLAIWGVEGERKFVDQFCPKASLVNIMSLEPYFYEYPWSEYLKGKKVLIIHPFTESIKKQLSRSNEIFVNDRILPAFESVFYIKAVQSNANAKTDFKSWFDALDYMKAEIDKIDFFDIAIIGAGAYGLPLTAYCKQRGKKAIQMAGAMQILFGIKGKRWEDRPEYVALMNDSWVRASKAETPEGIYKVEGGSYW